SRTAPTRAPASSARRALPRRRRHRAAVAVPRALLRPARLARRASWVPAPERPRAGDRAARAARDRRARSARAPPAARQAAVRRGPGPPLRARRAARRAAGRRGRAAAERGDRQRPDPRRDADPELSRGLPAASRRAVDPRRHLAAAGRATQPRRGARSLRVELVVDPAAVDARSLAGGVVMDVIPEITKELERELDWFTRVVDLRFRDYFPRAGDPVESCTLADLPPPDLTGSTTPWATFVGAQQPSLLERLALVLAMVPHLRPQL